MKKISKGMFLSIAGGIVLLLQAFGLKIDAPYVNEIIEAVCAVLIVLGIVTTANTKDGGDENAQSDKPAEQAADGELLGAEGQSEPLKGEDVQGGSDKPSGNKKDGGE